MVYWFVVLYLAQVDIDPPYLLPFAAFFDGRTIELRRAAHRSIALTRTTRTFGLALSLS